MAYKSDPESSLRSLTVEELISRLREASQEEASPYCLEIIRRFEPLLRQIWRRRVFTEEYQDFVQDVFVRMFGGLPSLTDPMAFPGYLLRVILSVSADYSRKSSAKWAKISQTDPVGIEEIASQVDDELLSEVFVRSYLEHLEPRDQQVLVLSVLEGYSAKEIGKALGLGTGTVRVIKSRALKKLRSLILSDANTLDPSSA